VKPKTIKSIAMFFYLVFFVTGLGTMFLSMPFPFDVGDERTASVVCLGIGIIFLITYYVFSAKEKTQS
jgi:hypothetical protein